MPSSQGPDPFAKLGLGTVINAAGKMTYLGGSALSPGVAEAMAAAGRRYVDMTRLQQEAARRIAAMTGAEAAVVTSCAASGLVAAIAACLTGPNLDLVRRLPDTQGWHRVEVVIQKGHAVDFGMPILQLIRMTGARAVEVGSINRTHPEELRGAITDRTAAVLHVISHHAQQDGMAALADVIAIAHERQVPVIVDAAAEMDLRAYVEAGADAVVYSGQKAVGAPTSGFVVGRRDLMEACRLQQMGIARPMKVGKEAIAGLLQALEEYATQPEVASQALWQRAHRLQHLMAEAVATAGMGAVVQIDVVSDPTRPIPRVRLRLAAGGSRGAGARELVRRLEQGEPSIRTRNHHVDSGIVLFDVRTLEEDQLDVVAHRVAEALEEGEEKTGERQWA